MALAHALRPLADDSKPNLRAKHVKQLTKTEMCKFFLSNRCGKGPRCPFAHSRSEIKEKPNLSCTSMCRQFLQSGNCDNPMCTFAHCERDLRTTGQFFKSKMCRFASSGRCKHGASCRFAHAVSELSPEAFDVEQAASGDTVKADASATLDYGSGDSDHASRITRDESNQGENAWRPQAQGATSTTDLWDNSFDQSSQSNSNDGNELRPITRSNWSAWSDQDQSTRADTTASVISPRGSEDSGREENSMIPPLPLQFSNTRRPTQRHPRRHCTTIMLTNVPQFLTQGSLLSLLEDLSSCMRGSFDFFFCPWNPYEDRNLGYAIINFFSRMVAAEFELQWTNQLLLPRTNGMKRLRVVPAALQGRAANLRHFSGFDLANHSDPRFRPLVRSGPHEPLRPMALARELSQASQNNNSDPHGSTAPVFPEYSIARQGQENPPYQQEQGRDYLPTEFREQFHSVNPQPQQQVGMRWSDHHGATLPRMMFSGLEAADLPKGNGMYGGYEDDFGMGSGAETPELENEHPLSRQASAQAPTALMAMLANLQTNQGTSRSAHETQERVHGDASERSVLVATQPRPGQNPTTPTQQGNFGFAARGDEPSTYDEGALRDFPYVVLQQGGPLNDAWQGRAKNGSTGGSDDAPSPMQPYWALVVPPGTSIQ